MSARRPMARPVSGPPPRITPTTPVLAMPVITSSQPNSRSLAATTPLVRTSSNASSGCWCRSRRQAVISGWNSAMRLITGIRLRSSSRGLLASRAPWVNATRR
jgi:hypothetical protein